MKISILCCVYNNAQWLRACLDSLINQTEKNIEILIGDDGSTDPEAIAIIDEYVAKDDRIILDRHENIGCGQTLNRLLLKATGVYIAEIDSDDAYELNAMETLWKLSENGKVDLVKGTYTALVEDREFTVHLWDGLITRESFRPTTLQKDKYLAYLKTTPSQWCAIYRRQWLLEQNIHWLPTPGALYQDTSFSLKAKIFANNVRLTNEPVYRYNLKNEASSVRKAGNFYALTVEYKSVEQMLKARHMSIWEEYARVKFGSYAWMLGKVDDVCDALEQMRHDMAGDIIFRDYYIAEELQLLDAMYGERIR